jgi:hypothetical protein
MMGRIPPLRDLGTAKGGRPGARVLKTPQANLKGQQIEEMVGLDPRSGRYPAASSTRARAVGPT